MACRGTEVWTFCTLVGAFLDLAIALLLLWCATITYLVSNFLSLFDLALPCPCSSGLFGAIGEGTCHLVQGPAKRIGSVQRSVRARPPFESILTPKVGNFRDWDGQESRGSSFRSCSLGSSLCFSASSRIGFDFAGGTPPSGGRVSWAVGKSGGGTGVEEDDAVRVLKLSLEEEQRARLALYVEFEKERSAAATAAEEAMAMIERLQKEKAMVKMNARQYQRMVEEKIAYDEGEMAVLKEIILRRERELYVLGKEVEMYRKGVVRGVAPQSSFESDDDNTSVMLQEICNSILKKKKKKKQNVISDDGNGNSDRLAAGDERHYSKLPSSELGGIGNSQDSSGYSTTNQRSSKSIRRRGGFNNTRMKSSDDLPLPVNGSLDSSIASAVNFFRFPLNSRRE